MTAGDHQILLAALSDVQSIEALARELVGADMARTWREQATNAMTNSNANVAVVREGAELVAFGVMEYLDAEARLLLFAVTPMHQHRGTASALLSWFEATAFVAGARAITVEVRREAVSRRFYREAGYRKEHIDRSTYCKSLDELRLDGYASRAPSRGDPLRRT